MRTFIDNSTLKEEYTCTYDWPNDCFIQGGSDGIVFSKNGNYRIAYFEAFPKNPKCFLRGEGETLKDAEENCYKQFLKVTSCEEHKFIRSKGYHNGMGTCTKCGLMTVVFEPEYKCVCCGKNNVKSFSNILPKYKEDEMSTICEDCAKTKEGFKYLSGIDIHTLCNYFNGIMLIYPIMDKETFELLKEKPKTLEDFLSICSNDSNIYLEESIKRMLEDSAEIEKKYPSLTHKVSSYDELYQYFYENYMERWIERGFPSK